VTAAFSIRPYAPSDAAACAHVFDCAWNAGHPYAPREIDIAVFQVNTEREHILVAEQDGQGVVAFASVYEPEGFVHNLYVDPAFQGRGIGTALLARAVALVGGRATLKCQIRNEGALAFYRNLGWIEIVGGEGEFGAWVAMRSPG
jgi:ribosomal protein S18 acetylase RimI-like enzyme